MMAYSSNSVTEQRGILVIVVVNFAIFANHNIYVFDVFGPFFDTNFIQHDSVDHFLVLGLHFERGSIPKRVFYMRCTERDGAANTFKSHVKMNLAH